MGEHADGNVPESIMHINAELIETALGLMWQMSDYQPDFSKKFRVVLDHDPEKQTIEVKRYSD